MVKRKIDVVTTCKLDDLQTYGGKMLSSFFRHWPASVDLHFVGEFDGPQTVYNHTWPAWHVDWKFKHIDNADAHGRDRSRNRIKCPDYDFRRDCVRFSHKVAALTEVARSIDTDILIWMDADIITHARITEEVINSWLPEPAYIAWLDRHRTYPECGFMLFDAKHPRHQQIMFELARMYKTDHVFELEQTHDSFVIENLIHRMVAAGYIGDPHNLSNKIGMVTGDPFTFSDLGNYMKHLKGKKKHAIG